MRLSISFKIDSEELEKLVKFAKENSTPEYWIQCLEKQKNEFQQFRQSTKNIILFILTAIGLLKLGFDEEKTCEILRELLEIDPKHLSPGSQNIH